VVLSAACTVKLSQWEAQRKRSDAMTGDARFRSPDPGASSVRIGDRLHVCVVTVRLPEADALAREHLDAHVLKIIPQRGTVRHTLKSPRRDAQLTHCQRYVLDNSLTCGGAGS
jgi:hypothetical protein